MDLFGSLAATGAGHGTMPAILLGLEGCRPETIETDEMERRLEAIRAEAAIRLAGRVVIALTESDMHLQPDRRLAQHPNAMTLTALSAGGEHRLPRDLFLGRRWIRRHRNRTGAARSGGIGVARILPFGRRSAGTHRPGGAARSARR